MIQSKSIYLRFYDNWWKFQLLIEYSFIYSYNLALDIDNDALQIAKENCSEFEVDVEFILADLISTSTDHLQNKVDTIVMNPPFGTKNNEGIDIIFLKKAIEVYWKLFQFGLIINIIDKRLYIYYYHLDRNNFGLFVTQEFYKRGILIFKIDNN